MVRLKEIREKKGFTQLQIAKRLGISLRSYQRYEAGERYPDVLTGANIVEMLKVGNLREIWGGNPVSKV